MKPTTRALIHGCYNTRNFGDLLLADLLAMHLRDRHGVHVVCPWVHRDVRGRLIAQAGRGWFDLLPARVAVYGGGGYLHGQDKAATRRMLRYAIPARVWQAAKVPYVVVGVGVGPILTGLAAKRAASICCGARAVSVRDETSRDLLIAAGVPSDKVEVTADLVMSLSPQTIPNIARVRAKSLINSSASEKRRLGLHLPGLLANPERLAMIAAHVRDALKHSEGIDVFWIQDHGEHSDLFRRIADEYLPESTVIPTQDHWTTAALIAELHTVITTKLHVGITAWALGVPPCGYWVHGKTPRFYEQIGRSAFQANASGPIDVIGEWINTFINSPDVFEDDNAVVRTKLVSLSRRNLEIIDEVLGPLLADAS